MKREEQIRNKARELGQQYFHDSANIWARSNVEAVYVENACVEMAEWVDQHPHWIPVEERLPEFVYPIGAEVKNTSDYVLVYNGYTMYISRLVGGEIHWWEDNSELAPTHWMEIVPPRKEE